MCVYQYYDRVYDDAYDFNDQNDLCVECLDEAFKPLRDSVEYIEYDLQTC